MVVMTLVWLIKICERVDGAVGGTDGCGGITQKHRKTYMAYMVGKAQAQVICI